MANAINAAPKTKRKKESMWAQVFRRLLKNPSATIGLAVIALLILLSILAPYITKYTYEEMDLLALNATPSWEHPFGTDSYFWVVSQFSDMKTEEAYKCQTGMTAVMGITIIILLFVTSLFI